MDTSKKYISLSSRLIQGEEVVCEKCGKGIYRPFNPRFKINHVYVCDNCGDSVHWDPVVDIE